MVGFSNFQAFTGGLASGAEAAMAAKQKTQLELDKEYREAAIKISVENEIKNADYKRQQSQNFSALQDARAAAGLANSNSTNAAQAQANTPIPSAPQVATPQSAALPAANEVADTEQPQQQQQPNTQMAANTQPATGVSAPASQPQQPAQAAGGMNSPIGGPVPLIPNQNAAPAPAPTSGGIQTSPTPEDEITDMHGATLTRAQAERAVAYGRLADPKNELSGDMQYMIGRDKVKEVDGKLGKYSPVDTSSWSDDDKAQWYMSGAKGAPKPLTKGEIQDNTKFINGAQQAKAAAQTGIATFGRLVANVSKIDPSPFASQEAYIKSAWSHMTGNQRSEALSTYFESQKEVVTALNSQINILRAGGGRFVIGAKVMQMEKESLPDISRMTPAASLAVMQSYVNNYRQIIGQADAIMAGDGEVISPSKRIQIADKYVESNPTTISDGITPNENFKEYLDYRRMKMDGSWTENTTGSQIRSDISDKISGARQDVEAGGKGKVGTTTTPNSPVIQRKDGKVDFDFSGY